MYRRYRHRFRCDAVFDGVAAVMVVAVAGGVLAMLNATTMTLVDASYFLVKGSCAVCSIRIPLCSHIKTCTNEIAPTNHNGIIFHIQIREGEPTSTKEHASRTQHNTTKAKSQVLVLVLVPMCMHSTCRKMNFHPHRIPLAPYTNYYQCLIKANVFNSVTIHTYTHTTTHSLIRICTHFVDIFEFGISVIVNRMAFVFFMQCWIYLFCHFQSHIRSSALCVCVLKVKTTIFWCVQHKEVNKYLMSTGKCEWLQCSLTPSMEMSPGKNQIFFFHLNLFQKNLRQNVFLLRQVSNAWRFGFRFPFCRKIICMRRISKQFEMHRFRLFLQRSVLDKLMRFSATKIHSTWMIGSHGNNGNIAVNQIGPVNTP